jgi:hypothetical protein
VEISSDDVPALTKSKTWWGRQGQRNCVDVIRDCMNRKGGKDTNLLDLVIQVLPLCGVNGFMTGLAIHSQHDRTTPVVTNSFFCSEAVSTRVDLALVGEHFFILDRYEGPWGVPKKNSLAAIKKNRYGFYEGHVDIGESRLQAVDIGQYASGRVPGPVNKRTSAMTSLVHAVCDGLSFLHGVASSRAHPSQHNCSAVALLGSLILNHGIDFSWARP